MTQMGFEEEIHEGDNFKTATPNKPKYSADSKFNFNKDTVVSVAPRTTRNGSFVHRTITSPYPETGYSRCLIDNSKCNFFFLCRYRVQQYQCSKWITLHIIWFRPLLSLLFLLDVFSKVDQWFNWGQNNRWKQKPKAPKTYSDDDEDDEDDSMSRHHCLETTKMSAKPFLFPYFPSPFDRKKEKKKSNDSECFSKIFLS